jgi:hypothetical protein
MIRFNQLPAFSAAEYGQHCKAEIGDGLIICYRYLLHGRFAYLLRDGVFPISKQFHVAHSRWHTDFFHVFRAAAVRSFLQSHAVKKPQRSLLHSPESMPLSGTAPHLSCVKRGRCDADENEQITCQSGLGPCDATRPFNRRSGCRAAYSCQSPRAPDHGFRQTARGAIRPPSATMIRSSPILIGEDRSPLLFHLQQIGCARQRRLGRQGCVKSQMQGS